MAVPDLDIKRGDHACDMCQEIWRYLDALITDAPPTAIADGGDVHAVMAVLNWAIEYLITNDSRAPQMAVTACVQMLRTHGVLTDAMDIPSRVQ